MVQSSQSLGLVMYMQESMFSKSSVMWDHSSILHLLSLKCRLDPFGGFYHLAGSTIFYHFDDITAAPQIKRFN